MAESAAPDDGDFWQQGGNPLIKIMSFITERARIRALDLDQRTVYRKRRNGSGDLEEVAIFKNSEDARLTVEQHNSFVQEKMFERIHSRLGNLIDRVESSSMGDPIV